MRKRRRTAAAAFLLGLFNATAHAQQVQWQAEPQTAPTNSGVEWSSEGAPAAAAPSGVVWEALPSAPNPEEPQVTWEPVNDDTLFAQPMTAPPPTTVVKLPPPASGPTFANFRALWRDGDWLPQISNTVPVGFGPQGFMFSLNYRAIDCITGAGLCTVPTSYQDWQDTVSRSGDAFFDTSFAFGDSFKAVGVVLTVVSENTNTEFAGRSGGGETIFGNANLGVHLSRNFGPDTAVRLGVENLVKEICNGGACGLPTNAYGVISQRLRLNNNQDGWFPNAYLTVGAGNGAFRPLSEQIRASEAAQRAAGCTAYNFQGKDCSFDTRRRAVMQAMNYGNPTPIGSIALEAFNGFHFISEWSGRNLNAGFSIRPFRELGFVITPMWENLIPNCDYGCTVNDPPYNPPIPSNLLTERARFSIQASVEFKF